ncbi:MAG: ATP-dependent nuclease [Brevinema sp.]
MKLKSIQNITNYRNLSNIKLEFGDKLTYIVGENNLGKSNIFDMFNHIFKVRDFTEDDFQDTHTSISMNCFFKKDNGEEISFWGDHFCDGNIKVEYSHVYDEHLTSCIEDDRVHKLLRKNFCYIPIYSGIGLDRSIPNLLAKKGAISYIFNKIESSILHGKEYINHESIESLKSSVQDKLNHISVLHDISISHDIDDLASMLASMLYLVDKSGKHIDYSGEGLKRRLHIILYILSGIVTHCENYTEYIKELTNNINTLNVVIAIDEPELHLHPHWQRQLINEISSLLDHQIFEELNLSFQMIIITHSPYMIKGSDYVINRLFLSETRTQNISLNIPNSSSDEKEIHDRYINQFREAYFAKGVLLVEGETEQGVLNAYNEFQEYCIENNGISIINVGGEKSLEKVYNWFEKLKIPVVGIIDRDDKTEEESQQQIQKYKDNLFISDKTDLEESLYDLIVEHSNANEIFNEIIQEKICSFNNNSFQMSKIHKKLYKKVYSEPQLNEQKDENDFFKEIEKEWKSIDLNHIISDYTQDPKIHKILYIAQLYSCKSMYEGSQLMRVLVEYNIMPRYLYDAVNHLIGLIRGEGNDN